MQSRIYGRLCDFANWRAASSDESVIGPHIVDFAALGSKLVIKVDGGQHVESAADCLRDAYLTSQGWQVLRFWNSQVLQELEGVLAVIHLASQQRAEAPHPAVGLLRTGFGQSSAGPTAPPQAEEGAKRRGNNL